MFKSLNKDTKALLLSRVSSMVGSTALPIALTFAVLDRHGSALDVGVVVAASDLPFVLLLLVGGVVADRHRRRLIALMSDGIRSLISLSITLVIALHMDSVLILTLLSVLWGSARAFFVPTIAGMVPEVTPAEQLHRANSLVGASTSLGNLVGPALAGLIVATMGPAEGALMACAAYITSSFFLARVSQSRKDIDEAVTRDKKRVSFLREIKEGYIAIRSKSWAFWTIVIFGVAHLTTFGPLFVVGPVIAARDLGGAASWGYIVAAEGVGALIGSLLAMRRPPRHPLFRADTLMLLGVPSFFLLALHVDLIYILLSVAVSGVTLGYFGSVWETLLQRSYPLEQISKVSSYDWMGSTALLPLGEAFGGAAAGVFGESQVLIFGGVALLTLFLILVALPSTRRVRYEQGGVIRSANN
ncbi:Predicted arabinose efflux permease, MFS family [Ferrithrix thermotolerans DSM 19514]|uniref:Predicted arabinose efflux permease, MFS family n=1 Tax=Ferrithrix thermotolerans DSM 19514 TaxID=1121881 RepID=A0A1M4UAV6_9ACTN|nr:MFS transporter [Ferrithrix thermotolerans]SHE53693.1 Predicted arabinose efflux permease, MFS family [Ferrithrix thermotolerans DSM 19514]